ncbi:MAG: MFS transporter [Bacteroidota bacterium]
MKPLKTISRLVGISREESELVKWMFLHSFCIGIFISFYFSTANSMFVNDWGSTWLPYGYVASGTLGFIIVSLYSRLQKRYSAQWLFSGVFVFLASVILLIALLNTAGVVQSNILSFCLFILAAPLLTLCALETAGLSMLLFDIRQSKRFFALFSSGEILASIIGYLIIPQTLKFIGSPYNFLYPAVIGAAIGLIVLTTIFSKYRDSIKQPATKKVQAQQHKKKVFNDGYVRFIALTVGLSYVAIYFADFGFLGALDQNHSANDDGVIKNIAIFFAIVKVGEFCLSIVSGSIFNRLGMRFALVILPILMFLCTALAFSGNFLASFLEQPTAYLLFIFLSANKFVDRVVRKSIEIPATRILYLPLPDSERTYIQTKIDGNVQQIGTAAAGISLIIFSYIFRTPEGNVDMELFTLAFLPLLLIWIFSAWTVFKGYKLKLADVLTNPTKAAGSYFRSGTDSLVLRSAQGGEGLSRVNYIMKEMNLEPMLETHQKEAKTEKSGNDNFLKSLNAQPESDRPELIFKAILAKDLSAKAYIVDMLHSATYAQLIENTIHYYGNEVLSDLEYVFERTGSSRTKRKIVTILKKIGTPESKRALLGLIDYHEPDVQHLAIEALSSLGFKVEDRQREFVRNKIEELVAKCVWVYSGLADLAGSPNTNSLIQFLVQHLDKTQQEIIALIGLIYGTDKTNVIKENLMHTEGPEMRVFAIEMLDNLLEPSLKEFIIPLFEDKPWWRKVRKLNPRFPQGKFNANDRLRDIIIRNYATTGLLVKAEAISILGGIVYGKPDNSIQAALFNKQPLVYESAAEAMFNSLEENAFKAYIDKLPAKQGKLILSTFRQEKANEKTIHNKIKSLRQFELLKDAHDYLLLDLALHIDIISLEKGSQLSMVNDNNKNRILWVKEGLLHLSGDGDRELGPGDLFIYGSLYSGLIDALHVKENTQAFVIEKNVFFDLMLDDETLTLNFIDGFQGESNSRDTSEAVSPISAV